MNQDFHMYKIHSCIEVSIALMLVEILSIQDAMPVLRSHSRATPS